MDYYPKAHPEDDGIIGVTIARIPRWKESELSGDEWRFTLLGVITYKDWRNGGTADEKITCLSWTETQGDVALQVAAWCQDNQKLLSPPHAVKDLADIKVCFQPGCGLLPVNVYGITQEWTDHPHQGHRMEKRRHPVVRAFCARHSHRGDCDLEDQDDNYELLAYFPQNELVSSE